MGWRGVVLVATVTVTILAGALLAPRPTSAQTDLTGLWDIELQGTLNLSCGAVIYQTGLDLTIILDCGNGFGLTGTFDKGTGAFVASDTYFCDNLDTTFNMAGTAAPDGNSLNGTWNTICLSFHGGTFTATRSIAPPPPASAAVGGVGSLANPGLTNDRGRSYGQALGIAGVAAVAVGLACAVAWGARRRSLR